MKIDFIIVGAAKSGTSSLYGYLEQHPSVCLSQIKETNYFAYGDSYVMDNWNNYPFLVATSAEYEAQFSHCTNGQIKGEASPIYLESKVAPERIKKEQSKCKVIIMLRNPVKRAFSGYLMHVRYGGKALDLESLSAEDFDNERRYVATSFYYEKVKKYVDLFGKQQVKVIIFEDFVKDAQSGLQDVCSFLNISDYEFDVSVTHNKGSYPKSVVFK